MLSSITKRCIPSVPQSSPRRYASAAAAGSLARFKILCSQQPDPDDYPHASKIMSRIPIYDTTTLSKSPNTLPVLKAELQRLLHHGPGVYILKHVYNRDGLIPRINSIFSQIIKREAHSSKGDHFAAGGANSRIWNSLGKHALLDPKSFCEYYSNPWLRVASESWLGPGYKMTTQCNIVKPGGQPQQPHRDYHLGFQTNERVKEFPLATQVASQFLTLQGAVAHSDMPLKSGPTRFLPYSQTFEEGYQTYRDPEFAQFFAENWVSVPMEQGDAVFFNPALFHAAGENTTNDVERSANLLQVSSAFGKTMESVDSLAVLSACWQSMREMYDEHGMDERMEALIRIVAEGYPFPTNLDRRPPAPGGMAPESEQDVTRRALVEGWEREKIWCELRKMREESMM